MGRVLVLIQVRRRDAPPQDKHTSIQPTHQLNYPKARKFAANPLGKSSALPWLSIFFLFEGLVARQAKFVKVFKRGRPWWS